MAELNSKELLQNIKDAIQAKPPKLGQDYILMPDHYRVVNAAITIATDNEKQRIIKLLEEHGHNPYSDSSCREGAECKSVASAIALIKGEQNLLVHAESAISKPLIDQKAPESARSRLSGGENK